MKAEPYVSCKRRLRSFSNQPAPGWPRSLSLMRNVRAAAADGPQADRPPTSLRYARKLTEIGQQSIMFPECSCFPNVARTTGTLRELSRNIYCSTGLLPSGPAQPTAQIVHLLRFEGTLRVPKSICRAEARERRHPFLPVFTRLYHCQGRCASE